MMWMRWKSPVFPGNENARSLNHRFNRRLPGVLVVSSEKSACVVLMCPACQMPLSAFHASTRTQHEMVRSCAPLMPSRLADSIYSLPPDTNCTALPTMGTGMICVANALLQLPALL